MTTKNIAVIGGGLAGCDVAWQAAGAGCSVTLFEMKPAVFSPAHEREGLAELVCSNSLRSTDLTAGIGLLQAEMAEVGSLVMEAALACRVPAGKALAVDRALFSEYVTEKISSHPNIILVRQEILSLDDAALKDFDAVVIAAGPLAGDRLTASLIETIGGDDLFFYDAIAPIISTDSVDMSKAFWASRYAPEEKDYLNCPMNEEEYKVFVQALLDGEKVAARDFEEGVHFEGCLPVETMAERGEMTLAFGPLKPVGLEDPHTGKQSFAVVQLRAENKDKTAMNLVGFQTKLKYGEQKRIFRMIPGLEQAEFLRLGSIHRNTFVNSPRVLTPHLELKARPSVYLAGQITGVEGYLESAACGLWLGMYLCGRVTELPPKETALGALLAHTQSDAKHFQPSNINFGLMPPLNVRAKKARRKELHAERARKVWKEWREESVKG